MCFLTLPPIICTAKQNAKTIYIKCMFAYTLQITEIQYKKSHMVMCCFLNLFYAQNICYPVVIYIFDVLFSNQGIYFIIYMVILFYL